MNEVDDIHQVVEVLLAQLSTLRKKVDELSKENLELKELLSRYQHPKDSHNSNLPSSKDLINKKVNLRVPSGKSSGGQKGHPGKTLEMQVPDTIEELSPSFCKCCGHDLSAIEGEVIERRQQIDIPPIRPVVTEYRTIRKTCQCSHINEGSFPAGVNSAIGYGANIHALVGYLNVCQHIPSERLTTLLKDIFGLPLSEGTVYNIMKRMEDRSSGVYEIIRNRISASPVVGVDETCISVNGKNLWAWVWQNQAMTYISAPHSRKREVFNQVMPGGMPDSVLITDCYSSYFSVEAKNHQICTSHILRELVYLSELYDNHPWCEKMSALIRDTIHLRKTTPDAPIDKQAVEQRLQGLLDEIIEKKYIRIKAFQKRLVKYRNYLFYFLTDKNVPPDNNASERAFRVFKVKLKVSGFFKSHRGAQCFAQLHSIADTARKNSQSPFFAFNAIALNCYKVSSNESLLLVKFLLFLQFKYLSFYFYTHEKIIFFNWFSYDYNCL